MEWLWLTFAFAIAIHLTMVYESEERVPKTIFLKSLSLSKSWCCGLIPVIGYQSHQDSIYCLSGSQVDFHTEEYLEH